MPYKDPQRRQEYARDYQRAWRVKNPERAHANAKRFEDKNRDKRNAAQAVRYYKRKYGITRDEFDAILVAQDFRCAICRTNDPG